MYGLFSRTTGSLPTIHSATSRFKLTADVTTGSLGTGVQLCTTSPLFGNGSGFCDGFMSGSNIRLVPLACSTGG